jgi:hypothetical protein
MKYAYRTPDRDPPFDLTEQQFSDISIPFCFMVLLISVILSFYNIFRSQNFKQLVLPIFLSIFVLTVIKLVEPNYTLKSEAMFPKEEFYYWQQNRQYRNETKFIRWKKPLNKKAATWELDSVAVKNNSDW